MKEFRIKSSDGVSNLACYMWDNVEGSPKAVLQIIHGMCEYVMRYDEFAKYLNSQGILVVGDDHIGHGKSVEKPEDLGYFGPRDGWLHLVQDEHLLRKTVQADYPDVPYIMLGHSFGSFLMRAYLALQSTKGLSGAIVMGTAGHNGALAAGHRLTKILMKLEGERTRSRLITVMAFGSYTKRIKNPVNTWAWLSTDDKVCIEAYNDPMHNWEFTLAGYNDMFSVLEFVGGDACMKAYDKELPILLVSGWEDPVGSYGKGPAEIAERLEDLGCNINMVLYEGMRHEVLNEIGKEAVWEDMRDYILDMADGNCVKDDSKELKVFAGM